MSPTKILNPDSSTNLLHPDNHPKFKEGDRVRYSFGANLLSGSGTICGLATAHILDMWIVRFDEIPDTETYNYSCVTVPHTCLTYRISKFKHEQKVSVKVEGKEQVGTICRVFEIFKDIFAEDHRILGTISRDDKKYRDQFFYRIAIRTPTDLYFVIASEADLELLNRWQRVSYA